MPRPLKLKEIDEKRNKLHTFFRFPGSFHPPLVNALLKNHYRAHTIGDPMSGSGCVAVEGIARNHNAVSMDIDPLSCLITKVKSNPVDPDDYKALFEQWVELAGPLPKKNESDEDEARNFLLRLETETNYSWPLNPFHWFEPYVVESLARLLLALYDLKRVKSALREALEATFASVIRRVSRADPQPVSGLEVTKIMKKRLEKGITYDVTAELRDRSKMLFEGYQHLLSLDSLGSSRVVQGDVRNDWVRYCRVHRIQFDLIITSPPYCNAIEYWRRHKLEYFWLGLLNWDKIMDKSRKFIGSTTILQGKLAQLGTPKLDDVRSTIEKIEARGRIRKARLLQKYFLDSEKWISSVLSTLSTGGTAYIIVGPSTSYGVYVDTPKFISDIIRSEGYETETFLEYSLKNQRMQYPTRNGAKIKTETVIAVSN